MLKLDFYSILLINSIIFTYQLKTNIMTTEEYNNLTIKNFKDLEIGERFMTVGCEIYEKIDEDIAFDIRSYHKDVYRFSLYSETRSLKK